MSKDAEEFRDLAARLIIRDGLYRSTMDNINRVVEVGPLFLVGSWGLRDDSNSPNMMLLHASVPGPENNPNLRQPIYEGIVGPVLRPEGYQPYIDILRRALVLDEMADL